jgi:formamidopyrimidine-DNA glycosylase
MPELPEVETIVREMREASLLNLSIKKAEVFWERSLKRPSPSDFCRQITGQKILKIDRRGKFLVFTLSEHTLLVHLRMTGKFIIGGDEIHPHERIRLTLSDGRILRYEDQRKFGKWELVDKAESVLTDLGIEPLSAEFTVGTLLAFLKAHSRALKPFLLDQKTIAGLGNIYVDEALWMAKVHPLRLTSSLTKEEAKLLHQAIRHVLTKGIENTGTSLGAQRANYFSVSGRRGSNQDELKVFRRDGLECPRCGETIIKITVAQRGTHICLFCQK